MSIRVEETPNPSTFRFIIGKTILDKSDGIYYVSAEESYQSPLAQSLFMIDGVRSVFFGHDFISVTKFGSIEWENLKPSVMLTILDFTDSGKDIFIQEEHKGSDDVCVDLDFNDPIVQEIHKLIEERVRPAVMQDGGNVIFKNFKDGVVYLKLQGACSGCPSASITLKNGIQNILQYYIEEVKDVQEVI